MTFVPLALLCGALCGCPLAECPPDNPETLPEGGSVHGLSPDGVLAPLLGDHVAILTWLSAKRVTTMHLDVERHDAEATYDCDHKFTGFTVALKVHLFSDDGIIDATLTDVWLTIDDSGHTPDPTWTWQLDLSFDSAAIVAPSVGPWVELSTPTKNLKPVDGQIVGTDSGSSVTVGAFRFLS